RVRQQDLVLDDPDLFQPVPAPLVAHPFREHPIAGRSGDVRCRGQVRVRLARGGAGGQRQKPTLARALIGRRARREPKDRTRRWRRCRERDTTEDTKDTEGNACLSHRVLTDRFSVSHVSTVVESCLPSASLPAQPLWLPERPSVHPIPFLDAFLIRTGRGWRSACGTAPTRAWGG